MVIGGALVVAYLIQLTSLQAFRIPSESMLPTLQRGDRVLVNKWSYRAHDVHRGDVVVFSRPPEVTDATIDDLIKRVVGLPGEEVTITGGHVEIDGRPLDEPYLADPARDGSDRSRDLPARRPVRDPRRPGLGHGRQPDHSEDSRWFGPIPESTIVGRASARIWPLNRLDGL